MRCPNCEKTYEEIGNVCPHCHVDVVVFSRASRLSRRLYNQGLAKLHSMDYTNGIGLLTKSIAIDKGNIQARNLLGLALFEVGHVGDALRHWVVSSSLLTEENPASEYLEHVKKNARVLEKLNDAVAMYNKALDHIKQKSDDLAVIQLKSAVENNPRFVDALNLLALCNLIQNDRERAITAVEKVLSIDAANPVATKYYSALSPGKGRGSKAQQIPAKFSAPQSESGTPYRIVGLKDKKPTNFHIAEILTFVIAVACTIAVFYFLLLPAIRQSHEQEITRMQQDFEQEREEHELALEELQEEIAEREVDINTLEATNRELNQTVGFGERVNLAHQAQWHFSNSRYQEAIDIIDDLDTTGFQFDIRERLAAIIEGSYPQLATINFEEGSSHYQEDDRLALMYLERAWRFVNHEEWSTQRRDLMIMLGNLYYNSGRYEEAYDMIAPVREQFPNHTPQALSTLLQRIEENLE